MKYKRDFSAEGMLLLVLTASAVSVAPLSPYLPASTLSCTPIESQPAGYLAAAIVRANLHEVNFTESVQAVEFNESNTQIAVQINETVGLVNEYLHVNFALLYPYREGLENLVTLVPQVQAYNDLVRDARAYETDPTPDSGCQLYVDAFALGASVGMFDATDAATVLSVLAFKSDLSQVQQLANYCGPCVCAEAVVSLLSNSAANYLSTSYSAVWSGITAAIDHSCSAALKVVNGVPEYPYQAQIASASTLVIVTSYLMARLRSERRPGRRAS